MRRFPPPRDGRETRRRLFKVVDANKQGIAYVYCRDDDGAAAIAKVLTEDEARRIALNIAKLPSLLAKGS